MVGDSTSQSAALVRYWRRHGVLVATLTLFWAAVSFVPPLLMGWARLPLFSMPVTMWFMAELAPLAFVAIAWWYAHRSDRLDAEHAADAER